MLLLLLVLFPLTLANLEGRLPTSILPEHYDLDYLVNLGDDGDRFDFSGNVSIKVKVLKATRNVVLNSKNLTIGAVTVSSSNGSFEVVEVQNDVHDFLNVTLTTELEEGHFYVVHIEFSGLLNESSFALYPDKSAATYFSGIRARRAFPCFDEPAFKATFTITLAHNSMYTALSNMPLKTTGPVEGRPDWTRSEFEKSIRMSTYLVAFVLTKYKSLSVEGVGKEGIPFRVWADEANLDKIDFALEIGPKFLAFFENICNISYPLPKVDMIAVPRYNTMAMEHFGLIIYSEFKLYYKPEYGAFRHSSSANTIAHELAHQWFGNLVTMKWYNDLWLSEGFARYMGNLAADDMFPTGVDSTAVSGINRFLNDDSYEDTRPVSRNETSIFDIRTMFGPMTYDKGAQVLRMSRLLLGEDTFNNGVCAYLNAHKYGVAVEEDLWKELTLAGHEDGVLAANMSMEEVMSTWTRQPGHPLLTVTRNYGGKSFSVQMERFPGKNKTEQCWWVPLTYTDQSNNDFENVRPKLWLPCTNEPWQVDADIADNDWLILNLQFSAFLRVNYDEENWLKLAEALNSPNYTDIPLLNRMQLAQDSSELFYSGDLSAKAYFNLCKYVRYEEDFNIWVELSYRLVNFGTKLERTALQPGYKEYMRAILQPLYVKVGGLNGTYENSSESRNFFKRVVAYSCQFDMVECIDDALTIFDEYMRNTSSLSKYDSAFLCTAIKHGDEDKWNFLWTQFSSTNETDIFLALSCTRNPALQRKLLDGTPNFVEAIRALLPKADALETVQTFLLQNAELVFARLYPPESIEGVLYTWADNLKTSAELETFKTYVETNRALFNVTEALVENTLEAIRTNIKWQEENFGRFADVFSPDITENQL